MVRVCSQNYVDYKLFISLNHIVRLYQSDSNVVVTDSLGDEWYLDDEMTLSELMNKMAGK